eukprot:scaffold703_cov168-Amphora_coffeaeformis.AAC.17
MTDDIPEIRRASALFDRGTGDDGASSIGVVEAMVIGLVATVVGVLGECGDFATSLRTITFAWLRSQHHIKSHHDGSYGGNRLSGVSGAGLNFDDGTDLGEDNEFDLFKMAAPLVDDVTAAEEVFRFLGYRPVPRNSSEYVGFMASPGWILLLRGVSARLNVSGPEDFMSTEIVSLPETGARRPFDLGND